MPTQDAVQLTLKIDDDTGTNSFIDVGGFTTNSFDIASTNKPYVTKDTAGWRTTMNGGGNRYLMASGEGVFDSLGAIAKVLEKLETGTLARWQITAPGLGVFEGLFGVTSLKMQGKVGDAITYSIALESSGPISMQAV